MDMDIFDFGHDGILDLDSSDNLHHYFDDGGSTYDHTIYDDPNSVILDGHDILYTNGIHPSFGHAPNDGTYSKTSSDVHVVCETGADKGLYDVYLHHGSRYIDFHDTWIKLPPKGGRFLYGGNAYIVR